MGRGRERTKWRCLVSDGVDAAENCGRPLKSRAAIFETCATEHAVLFPRTAVAPLDRAPVREAVIRPEDDQRRALANLAAIDRRLPRPPRSRSAAPVAGKPRSGRTGVK